MMLGQIFQHVKRMEGVKMVNTIHDSIMFDVKEERVDDFVVWITRMLGDTHEYFHKIFKTPLALKLNAGASVGVNWYEMQEI
jgi:DNA polymerase I-like protein with 3'-5' exonuclease and polymerase domains